MATKRPPGQPRAGLACLLALWAGVSSATEPPTLTNSLGMQLVLIPAGQFRMGSDATMASLGRDFPQYPRERLADLADEGPVHPVVIRRPFYLARHEVTVGQFRRFLKKSGYVPESIADGTGGYGFNPAYDPDHSPRKDAFEGRNPRYSWEGPGFAQDERHPVVNVTWNDAQALGAWLSREEGRRYRLPTEAEWEYACRAGAHTHYFHGDTPQGLSAFANLFDARSAREWPRWQRFALPQDDGHAFTSPVGGYHPNAWGLYDMHGNVWEWTSDWYGADYYSGSPLEDPRGPTEGRAKVRRGGSWHTWPLYARCAFRNWNTPQTRYTLVGMRLVLEAPRDPGDSPGDR